MPWKLRFHSCWGVRTGYGVLEPGQIVKTSPDLTPNGALHREQAQMGFSNLNLMERPESPEVGS